MMRAASGTACVTLLVTALAGVWYGAARADDAPRRSARHDSVTEGLDCSTCHTSAGWKMLDDHAGRAEGGGFDHSRTGFPLTGRHAYTPCTGCHRAGEKITRACAGCHQDAHERRFGTECDECHDARNFHRVSAIELHSRTRLPLTGMHVLADCTQCHRAGGSRQWSTVPADCFACHADEYRSPDIHPRHAGGAGQPAFSHQCSQCHRAISWSPAFVAPGMFGAGAALSIGGLRLDAQRHEMVFPIAHGPHRGADCADCHGSERISRIVRCTGCHAHDPVRLRQDHKKHPAAWKDGACLHCHAGGAAR